MGEEIKIGHWSNGQIQFEFQYLKGNIHGLSKQWHSNGQLWIEIPYISGNRNGFSKWWHEDGQIYYETPYKNNLQCGARIIFEY